MLISCKSGLALGFSGAPAQPDAAYFEFGRAYFTLWESNSNLGTNQGGFHPAVNDGPVTVKIAKVPEGLIPNTFPDHPARSYGLVPPTFVG